MLLNEAFDLRTPESCNFSQTDARQEWLLSSCVIVDPSLANPQPFRDLVDSQQTIGVRDCGDRCKSEFRPLAGVVAAWAGEVDIRLLRLNAPLGPSRAGRGAATFGPLSRLYSDTAVSQNELSVPLEGIARRW